MNLNRPSQEAIAVAAYHLWEKRGHPAGVDADIWLEAEAELVRTADDHAAVPGASVAQHAIAPTPAERKSLVTELQKQQARAPQVPHHTGPAAKPPESGKPVWPKAHSA